MLGFNGGRLGPQNSMSSYPLSASGVFSLNEVALQKGITGNIVTSNLVLNLDAGNSLSYPGTGTTWTDLSSSGNNATLVNGAGFSSADGGAITFDGTNDTVLYPVPLASRLRAVTGHGNAGFMLIQVLPVTITCLALDIRIK